MSLPQLQQYASLHKDDPYVVTMALSIANQKKQAMTAQQGQAGQQPMPKVVDQEIAQMAPQQQPPQGPAPMPEEVGIGQLPTPNIAKMAGGGIVAFGEGGDVPGYADEGLVKSKLAELIKNLPEDSWLRKLYESEGPLLKEPLLNVKPPVYPTTAQPAQPAQPTMQLGPNLGATDASLGAAGEAAVRNQPAPLAKPAAQQPVQQPVQQAQQSKAASPAAAPAPGLITDQTGIQKVLADMQSGIKPQVPDVVSGGISDLQKAEEAAAAKNVADIEAEQKGRGLAFKEFESRLKDREGRISKSEEQLGPLALLQAGLAIMGGASPFAAVNIGAGAQVGLKSYTEGADKIERAREKMDEAYAKIEEIRRNEGRMDAKELRDARNAALKPAIDAKKLTLSALEKDWGLQRQEAVKGVELLMQNQRSMYEQTEQTKRTGMQIAAQKEIAAMPPAEARTAMLLGTGTTPREQLESGMRKMAEISQDKSSAAFAKLYATHLDESNKQGVQPMSPDAYAASLQKFVGAMLPRVTSSVPGNATVRTQ